MCKRRLTLIVSATTLGGIIALVCMLPYSFLQTTSAQLLNEKGCLICHDGIEIISDKMQPILLSFAQRQYGKGAGYECTVCHEGNPSSDKKEEAHSSLLPNPSSMWVLHRGMGKLVRVPALQGDHFKPEEQSELTWFHCRHTLPELWAEREISLKFEGVNQEAEVYLNGELVGAFLGENTPYTIDITDKVYYVRDNHLVVLVYDPNPASCGISGNILVVSTPPDQIPRN